MKKKHFLKEINLSATQSKGNKNSVKEVMKIQSWLCLYEMKHPGSGTFTGIDGDFGPATVKAVKNFQQANTFSKTGIVDSELFHKMCSTLQNAFQTNLTSTDLRNLVVEVAQLHLSQFPMELMIKNQTNTGPWVRSYMDGNEGVNWLWCMGFVQTVIDQAFSKLGKDFTTMMPLSYSCDTVGTIGVEKKVLIRNEQFKADPLLVKKGDIFLLRKSKFDWIHTGIILEVGTETIETIEGNTNADGSRNGNGVYRRIRNFQKSKIDVFSIQNWV